MEKNKKPIYIFGPCSIDTRENLFKIADKLSSLGVKYLRGGAFKPRTSPYSFKGLNLAGLKILKETATKYNMLTVSEILDVRNLDLLNKYVDVIQIGARNMQNFTLLNELGKTDKKIIIKRGFMSTIEELLYAVEYIVNSGNENILICERGIRTFVQSSRFSLDITSIPVLKDKTDYPIIVDPSHSTGYFKWVSNISYSAIAAGADGLMLETHITPWSSLSDSSQIVNLEETEKIINKSNEIYKIVR